MIAPMMPVFPKLIAAWIASQRVACTRRDPGKTRIAAQVPAVCD